jgi:thioester reductase-like protein
LVIHNAWPVNFNLGLPAFRPQLAGMVNLFALAAGGGGRQQPMRVVFVSSVGAVSGRPLSAGLAPEEVLEDLDTPLSNGYSRSKFIAELLCDAAARHLGLSVAVLRVGQIAGSAGGSPGVPWNRTEWIPSLVLSSLLRLGCLPDSLGASFSDVDWLPGDVLANAVCELALREEDQPSSGAEVFHLRNPRTTSWSELLPAVVDAARARTGGGVPPEVVAPSVWLARLQESAENHAASASVAASNPAIKLVDFYRDAVFSSARGRAVQAASPAAISMSVTKALAASPTLRDMPAVRPEWMRKWVDEWAAVE